MKCSLLTLAAVISAGFTFAADVFDAGPERRVVHERTPAASTSGSSSRKPSTPETKKGDYVKLKRGEINEAFRSSKGAKPEMAFYLPQEGVHIMLIPDDALETEAAHQS